MLLKPGKGRNLRERGDNDENDFYSFWYIYIYIRPKSGEYFCVFCCCKPQGPEKKDP